MNKPLHNYLRSYRQKASLTQDELAFLLGGSHGSTITRHEEYLRVPSLTTALRYAAVYREDPRVLFAGRYAEEEKRVRTRATILLERIASEKPNSRQGFLHGHLLEVSFFDFVSCELLSSA